MSPHSAAKCPGEGVLCNTLRPGNDFCVNVMNISTTQLGSEWMCICVDGCAGIQREREREREEERVREREKEKRKKEKRRAKKWSKREGGEG